MYYVLSFTVLPQAFAGSSDLTIIQAGFSFTIAISLLLTSHLIRRFELKNIVISALITSTALFLLLLNNFPISVLSIFVAGISFSIGQLTSFTYFWKTVEPEQRGRIAGVIGFISLLLFFVLTYLIAPSLSLFGKILLCIILGAFGPIAILLLKPSKKEIDLGKQTEYYPEKRVIILYTIPWILFSLLNATLAKNIAVSTSSLFSPSVYFSLIVLQTIAALFGALFGGLTADYVGRRSTLALSMTLYGISMLFRILNFEAVFFLVYIMEGLSWGIFLTLYSFVIWGDLSNARNCAKLYATGLIIFYIVTAIGQLPSFISQLSPLTSTLISGLIIFLANIPIVIAPELLPPDIQERIKLRKYIHTVKKISKKLQTQQ